VRDRRVPCITPCRSAGEATSGREWCGVVVGEGGGGQARPQVARPRFGFPPRGLIAGLIIIWPSLIDDQRGSEIANIIGIN